MDAIAIATGPMPVAERAARAGGSDAGAVDELAGLIRLMSQGCPISFEALYRRTCGRLFGIILRVNSDRGEAEEVLQETYLKVWHRCEQFDPIKGQASHWLAGIARNGKRNPLSVGPSGFARNAAHY